MLSGRVLAFLRRGQGWQRSVCAELLESKGENRITGDQQITRYLVVV